MLRRRQLPIVGMGKFVMEGKLFPSSSQPARSVGMCVHLLFPLEVQYIYIPAKTKGNKGKWPGVVVAVG